MRPLIANTLAALSALNADSASRCNWLSPDRDFVEPLPVGERLLFGRHQAPRKIGSPPLRHLVVWPAAPPLCNEVI